MRLPQVTRRHDPRRGAAGARHRRRLRAAAALSRRRHRTAATRREGETATALFEAMETARCEAVGARAMPGTAGNIDAKIADEARRASAMPRSPTRRRRRWRRPRATWCGTSPPGASLPHGAQNVMDLWRGFLEATPAARFEGLDEVLDDQQAFARFARQVIADLGYGDQLGDDPDEDDEDGRGRGRRRRRGPAGGRRRRRRRERARSSRRRTRRPTSAPIRRTCRRRCEAADDADMAEELEVDEGEAPERAAAAAAFRGRPRLQGLHRPGSTRRSPPRTWPTRPSWSGCAPISTSSSSR